MDNLSESADQQRMAIRAVQAEHVDSGLAPSRENDLPNAQERCGTRNGEQFSGFWIRGCCIDLFISVSQADAVFALQSSEQRTALQGCARKPGKLFCR